MVIILRSIFTSHAWRYFFFIFMGIADSVCVKDSDNSTRMVVEITAIESNFKRLRKCIVMRICNDISASSLFCSLFLRRVIRIIRFSLHHKCINAQIIRYRLKISYMALHGKKNLFLRRNRKIHMEHIQCTQCFNSHNAINALNSLNERDAHVLIRSTWSYLHCSHDYIPHGTIFHLNSS